MPTVAVTLPNDGDTATVSPYNTAINAILAVFNGGLDSDNIAAGGVNLTRLTAAVQAALNPAGSIMQYGGSSAPTGYLICDGSAVNRTTYASLFAILSTTFGTGDGSTTFNLPDFRSRLGIGAGAGTFTTTFASTDVNTGTEVITVPSNTSLYTGTPVVLTTTGALPTGLSLATTYYVIRLSATTISLATTLASAVAGTAINLTAAGSGTNTITVTLTNNALGAKGGEETHALVTAEIPAHTHAQSVDSSYNAGSGGAASHYAQNNTGATTASGGLVTGSTGSSTAHNNLQPFVTINYIIKT